MLLQVKQIAGRIRELREILELSPSDIAKKIDVSDAVYLDYENAKTDIPIGKLYMIADALNVDPTVLLVGDSPKMIDYTIVRQGKGIDVERFAGYRFSALAYNFIGREMEPMIVTLDPSNKKPALVTHAGQELNYVLEGAVVVVLKDKELLLNAGDSIYFNPKIPHGQYAAGDMPTRFLTVINE